MLDSIRENISNRACFNIGVISDEEFFKALYENDELFNLLYTTQRSGLIDYVSRSTGLNEYIASQLLERDVLAWVSAVKVGKASRWESLRSKFTSRLLVFRKNKTVLTDLSELMTDRTGYLDVGCGMGFTMMAAASLGYEKAHGLEIDPIFAATGQKFMGTDFANQTAYALADFLDFPCRPPYSLITFFDVMEHIADRDLGISRALNMLTHEGAIYFYQGNGNGLQMVRSEPHYRWPMLSMLPKDIAIKVLLSAGRIQKDSEYVVNAWPDLSLFAKQQEAYLFVGKTNFRSGEAYLTEEQGLRSLESLPSLMEGWIRPHLSSDDYARALKALADYTARFHHWSATDKDALRVEFLMNSWNILVAKAPLDLPEDWRRISA